MGRLILLAALLLAGCNRPVDAAHDPAYNVVPHGTSTAALVVTVAGCSVYRVEAPDEPILYVATNPNFNGGCMVVAR